MTRASLCVWVHEHVAQVRHRGALEHGERRELGADVGRQRRLGERREVEVVAQAAVRGPRELPHVEAGRFGRLVDGERAMSRGYVVGQRGASAGGARARSGLACRRTDQRILRHGGAGLVVAQSREGER